jgi:hypothetical protein
VAKWPDIEAGLKDWLKLQPAIIAAVGNKVFFGIPNPRNPPFPLIALGRIGGGPQLADAPLDDGVLQIDCWAETKGGAFQVCQALLEVLEDMESVSLGVTVFGYGTHVESVIGIPDSGSKTYRYSVTATVTARASVA